MNIILMYGGRSGEHEISLMSCTSVARNISDKHNITFISVSKDGKWYLEDSYSTSQIKSNADISLEIHPDESKRVSIIPGGGKSHAFFAMGKSIPCDCVLPVMHGSYSEDGTLQGLFEMADIPYAGCDTRSSACAMDKETAKILLEKAGIPVVPYVCLTKAQINDSRLYDKLIEETVSKFGFPLFVKPCSAGSSDGASKAETPRQLSAALMEAFSWDNKVLIEKAINAREVECSVTGNSITADPSADCTLLKAYGPGEIVPKHTFYDYDAKYNDPDGAELKIPALLSDEKNQLIRDMAKKAFTALNCCGLSRVDFFIDKDTDQLYLNEINTLPGFTKISMFPKMCEADGLTYTNLIDYIINEGIEQYKAKSILCTSRI